MAVIQAPADASLPRPKTWGEGGALAITMGQHHISLGGSDHYPNAEFSRFYEMKGELPLDDPRAADLVNYWASQGHEVTTVYLAAKTKPALVVGVVTENGMYETTEGPVSFNAGAVILQSPDDDSHHWIVAAEVFKKRYQGITML